MDTVLFAENIRKTYKIHGAPPLSILRGVELSISAGEKLAILGASGSGKSTLLNILGGLDRADKPAAQEPAPQLLICGEEFGAATEHARARIRSTRIGFVFQSFQLLSDLTIEENVMLPAMASYVRSRRRSEVLNRARGLLAAAGLGERLSHRPAQLSGGEQQRVAIARALMNSPRVILADEPTGNLDGATGEKILSLLFDLSGEFLEFRPAVVMVTHSLDTARHCDRVSRLENGVLRAESL